MGLDIMFFKTKNKDLKKASDAYTKDLHDAIDLYQVKTNRLLKRLSKHQGSKEEYDMAYTKFLASMENINKFAASSIVLLKRINTTTPSIELIKDVIKRFEPKIPKYSVYYRKLWFIYDYVLNKDIIKANEEYCWLDKNALDCLIMDFTNVLNSNTNYYGFMSKYEDIRYLKVFIKDMRHLRRYLKDDEKIYINFCF